MWLGPIHDSVFAERVLSSIKGEQAKYKTWARMYGMMRIAQEVSAH